VLHGLLAMRKPCHASIAGPAAPGRPNRSHPGRSVRQAISLDNGRYVYDASRQHRRTFTKSVGSEAQQRTYAYDCSHAFRGGFSAASYTYDPNRVQLSEMCAPTEVNPHQASFKAPATTIVFRYYGLRYYCPASGRWLSRDPIEERGGSNLYGFGLNNSISNIDGLGLLVDGTALLESPITVRPVQPGPTPGIPNTPDGPELPELPPITVPGIGIGGGALVGGMGILAAGTGYLQYKAYIEPAIDDAFSESPKPDPFPFPTGFDPKSMIDDKKDCGRHRGVIQAQAGPKGSQSFIRSAPWSKSTPLTLGEGRGLLVVLLRQMNSTQRGVFYGAIIRASQWMTQSGGVSAPCPISFYVRDYPGPRPTMHPGAARIDINVIEGTAFVP